VAKGVSFTCDIPRVIVNPQGQRVRVTFREMEEIELMELLSGAVNAFNRLLQKREEERELALDEAANAKTQL